MKAWKVWCDLDLSPVYDSVCEKSQALSSSLQYPPSFVPRPPAGAFLPPRRGTPLPPVKGGKNGGKGAQAAGQSRPVACAAEAAKRGPGVSPGARLAAPTGRQGIVRYTALTTARENARPAL